MIWSGAKIGFIGGAIIVASYFGGAELYKRSRDWNFFPFNKIGSQTEESTIEDRIGPYPQSLVVETGLFSDGQKYYTEKLRTGETYYYLLRKTNYYTKKVLVMIDGRWVYKKK